MPDWELPAVDRIVVGTVGPPGQRVFLLQARQGPQLVTLKLEKVQVGELARRLAETFADLPEIDDSPLDDELLEEPVEPDFVVGALAVAFDEEADRLVLIAEELVPEGEEGSSARIGATRRQIAALIRAGADLVEAGRPPCPLCGYPLDPRGHVCPRSNGHGPPRT